MTGGWSNGNSKVLVDVTVNDLLRNSGIKPKPRVFDKLKHEACEDHRLER